MIENKNTDEMNIKLSNNAIKEILNHNTYKDDNIQIINKEYILQIISINLIDNKISISDGIYFYSNVIYDDFDNQ